jgi:hypothetical protein
MNSSVEFLGYMHVECRVEGVWRKEHIGSNCGSYQTEERPCKMLVGFHVNVRPNITLAC